MDSLKNQAEFHIFLINLEIGIYEFSNIWTTLCCCPLVLYCLALCALFVPSSLQTCHSLIISHDVDMQT